MGWGACGGVTVGCGWLYVSKILWAGDGGLLVVGVYRNLDEKNWKVSRNGRRIRTDTIAIPV